MRTVIALLLPVFHLLNGQTLNADTPALRHFCPRNQRWLQCGPPCGDRRCPRPINSVAFRCNSGQCGSAGCYCDVGYVRDENGDCILESECPPRCQDDNEQVDRCGNECERQCPSSLEVASRLPSCHRQTCGRPACVCKQGFYRSPRGSCVKLDDCPNICGFNEFYNPCGNACEDTCRRYNSGEPNICPDLCSTQGACQCKSGFYRNSQGRCVPPSQCLQCRGRNEIPDKCAPPVRCQQHCFRGSTEGRCFHNSQPCRPGCVCRHGFVRNFNNECIPREQCRHGPRDH